MRLMLEEKFNKRVKNEFSYDFDISEKGLYVIEITARAKNWLQNTLKLISFFKDDDLAVKIDGREFPKLSGKRGLFDSEAAWNGNKLKDLSQTNVFFIYLDAGSHILQFIADQSPLLETIRIYQTPNEKNILFEPIKNYQTARGNRRPWLNFILIDLALEGLKIQASADQKRRDDDDLQLKINGERQINDTPKSHKYWYWCGRVLKGQPKIFNEKLNLSAGLHYFELWADGAPILKAAEFIKLKRQLMGRVALYQDIEITDIVNLRNAPNHKDDSNIITTLRNGDLLEILEERVIGSWAPFKSYIWHKVKYKDETGYVLSSFVEIEGQKREIIINQIKQIADALSVDEKLALALAGCESKYKTYATSSESLEFSAKGIFQLTATAIEQLAQNESDYHFTVADPFEVKQNIEGGLRYLKWLHDFYYKGVSQKIEKLIGAYNQGLKYFPPNAPLDYSRIPAEERRAEAKRTVDCVLKNKNRSLVKPIVLILFAMIFGGVLTRHLYINDFFEPVLSEKEALLMMAEGFPDVIFHEKTKTVIFVNSQKRVIAQIPVSRLDIEQILKVPDFMLSMKRDSFYATVISESPNNIFHFQVATNLDCGASNCTWAAYRYNAEADILEFVELK